MVTKVITDMLEEVATASTSDTTSLNSANAGKVVQLNSEGAIPSVYFNPVVDQWRLTADLSGTTDPVSSDLSRAKQLGGDSMTVTSGVWLFPKPGIYKVEAVIMTRAAGATGAVVCQMHTTTNADVETPTWTVVSEGSESGLPTVEYGSLMLCSLVDVTSTTAVGVKFSVTQANSGNLLVGDANVNKTFFTFTRIGDT